MVIDAEEVITRQLAVEVGALAEAIEVILGERPHERVLAVVQPGVRIVIGKVDARVAVDHVDDDGDAVLVRDVDQLLKIRAIAEALVDAEVADREDNPSRPRAGRSTTA